MIEFQIYAKNKFKKEKKKEAEAMSEDYLEEILPNTEVILEELVMNIDQETYRHLLDSDYSSLMFD